MLNHIQTFKAGQTGYQWPHQRGTIDVYYDSKRYVYERPAHWAMVKKDWKLTLECAFNARAYGRAPRFTIRD
jgi:hypothetical protein